MALSLVPGLLLRSHTDLRGPRGVLTNKMEVFLKQLSTHHESP